MKNMPWTLLLHSTFRTGGLVSVGANAGLNSGGALGDPAWAEGSFQEEQKSQRSSFSLQS